MLYRKCNETKERPVAAPLFQHKNTPGLSSRGVFMELAGIEPASKDSSIPVSSITVCVLRFPHTGAHRQARVIGSFMIRFNPQSFGRNVLRLFDAGHREQRMTLGPTAALRQRVLNFYLQRLFFSDFLRGSGPRMAAGISKSLSKPVQPLV